MSDKKLTYDDKFLSEINDPITNFNNWINTSPAGAKYTYWTGFICNDRERDKDVCSVIANRAWKLYEKGVLILTQRKIKDDQYQYVAVKAARD